MPSRFTVLVPAHDEERTIARLLSGLQPPPGRADAMAVIVICNACRDATAARAMEACPQARVIELAEPGKAHAINAGLALVQAFPVIIVDADVRVDFAALEAVADRLNRGDAALAAPRLAVDTAGASRWVRAYYRVWLEQPYVTEDLTGSGIYGLSEQGVRRLGQLPPLIADDAYARSRFTRAERRSVERTAQGAPAQFTITAPANLPSLLRIEARRRAGDAELRAFAPPPPRADATSLHSLRRASRASLADKLVYAAIKLAGRLLFRWNRLRGQHRIWWRDESSRI